MTPEEAIEIIEERHINLEDYLIVFRAFALSVKTR